MQHDIELLKGKVDCRMLVEADLGSPARHSSSYSSWRCVFHHERIGYSLVAYRDHWRCFGKCNESGDCIAWLMKVRAMSFTEALSFLAGNPAFITASAHPNPNTTAAYDPPLSEPPDAEWQRHAMQLVEMAEQLLWSAMGRRALQYLTLQRGLDAHTIRQGRLGFLPGHHEAWKTFLPDWYTQDGALKRIVRAPCGVLIPHFANGDPWALRVRRAIVTERNSKYEAVRGGRKALYWADEIQPLRPILIVEGEFDCLTVAQCAGDLISPVAIASASNKRINRRWWSKLVSAPQIYVRMDADNAGQQALVALQQLSRRVRPVQVPGHKDVNDLLRAEGRDAVRQWISSFLN